jgi:hypothetical protein
VRYKIEAAAGDGNWIELVRGEGDLDDAREKARELASRAHNRDVEGYRISEFADASYTELVTTHALD